MSTREIKVARRYYPLRIGSYECELDRDRNPIKKSVQIAGWYGLFTDDRMKKEILPKLREYAAQGKHYPFLIGTYQLKNEAVASLRDNVPTKKVKGSDIRFSRRRRKSDFVITAIVRSASEYELVNR